LGENVNKYAKLCDMEKENSMSDTPFLSAVRIKVDALPGVRGGSLNFGNCKNIGTLVRVKIKFHDRSKKFFNRLLDKYTDSFGKADSYLGDAFKNVIAWQWLFENNKGEKVSLVLMWSRDKEVRPGVSIKMTQRSLLNEEYNCYQAKFLKQEKDAGTKTAIKNINSYVPR
jgi:hypothetical protein